MGTKFTAWGVLLFKFCFLKKKILTEVKCTKCKKKVWNHTVLFKSWSFFKNCCIHLIMCLWEIKQSPTFINKDATKKVAWIISHCQQHLFFMFKVTISAATLKADILSCITQNDYLSAFQINQSVSQHIPITSAMMVLHYQCSYSNSTVYQWAVLV